MNIIRVNFKPRALRESRFEAETPEDVRLICKELLEKLDYIDFLLAIMDKDFYVEADEEIRQLVDAYYDRMNDAKGSNWK